MPDQSTKHKHSAQQTADIPVKSSLSKQIRQTHHISTEVVDQTFDILFCIYKKPTTNNLIPNLFLPTSSPLPVRISKYIP